MQQAAAPASPAIRIVTSVVLALDAGLYVGALAQRLLLLPAGILSVLIALCFWFWTPVSYDLSNGALTVSFRIGQKRYQPVTRCSLLDEKLGFTIRLFGNGGLFSGSGIFWNRQLGVFRAYLTATKPGDMVLVETATTRIIVSPENPALWVAAATH